MSERCFICGGDNPTVLEDHHIIPQRFDGPDNETNTVTLCSNCHSAVEKIYSDQVIRDMVGHATRSGMDPEHESGRIEQAHESQPLVRGYGRAVLEGWIERGEHYDYVNVNTHNSDTPELRVNVARAHADVVSGLEESDGEAIRVSRSAEKARQRLRKAYEKPGGCVVSFSLNTSDIARCVGFDLNRLNTIIGGGLPEEEVFSDSDIQ